MAYKATLVSIVPFDIHETKPGIFPGVFDIPACEDDTKPVVFPVEEAFFWVEIDIDRSIQIKVPPNDLAKSIIRDYETACLEYSTEHNAGPGLFYVEDECSQGEIVTKHSKQLKATKEHQHNWFIRLVELADKDWQRIQNPRAISDVQRYAARKLNLDRPWLINVKEEGIDVIKCFYCKVLIPSDAIICQNCKMIVNKEEWDKSPASRIKV